MAWAPIPRAYARRWSVALLALSSASTWKATAQARPVIPQGSEQAVVALFRPSTTPGVVADGYSIDGIQIDVDTITVRLRRGRSEARLVLRPRAPSDREGSRSFGFAMEGDVEPAHGALERLKRSVVSNDKGGLYLEVAEARPARPEADERSPDAGAAERGRPAPVRRAPSSRPMPLPYAGLTAAGALLVAASLVAARKARASRRFGRGTAVDALVALTAFGALYWAAASPPLRPDTVADYLLARDLAAGHPQPHATSMHGVSQGLTLPWLLHALGRLGLGPTAIQAMLLGGVAVAVGLVHRVTRVALRSDAAVWAATAALTGFVATTELPAQWNPTLAPLPVTLCFVGVVAGAHSRGIAPWLVSFAGLVLAAESHVMAWALGAPLLSCVATLAPRPRWTTLAVASGLGVAFAVIQPFNVVAAREHILGIAAVAFLAMGIGAIARRMMPTGPKTRALATTMLFTTVVVGGTAVGTLIRQTPVDRRYLLLVVPPLAVLAGGALASLPHLLRLRRNARGALAIGLCLLVAMPLTSVLAKSRAELSARDDPWEPSLTMADGRALGAELLRRGYTFDVLAMNAQGLDTARVTRMLALAGPLRAPGARSRKGALRLMGDGSVDPRDPLPRLWERHQLSTHGALLLSHLDEPWLDVATGRIEARMADGRPVARLDARDAFEQLSGGATRRSFSLARVWSPALVEASEHARRSGARLVRQTLVVHIRSSADRVVRLTDPSVRWHFVGARGVEASLSDGTRRAVLSGRAGTTGELVVEQPFTGRLAPRPDYIELSPAEERALFGEAR